MNKDINIVFIADQDYILTTTVAIRSLLKSLNCNYNYYLYIVADYECQKIWEKEYPFESANNVSFKFITPNITINEMEFEHFYVSKAALLKFCLPDLLPDLEKVLYVDGDILVYSDLVELYNFSLENVYAAVVKDMLIYKGNHLNELGLDDYFNSGMMLLNLSFMRRENVTRKLFDYKKNEICHMFMDQDAFNIVFAQKVKFVSPIYNYICECDRNYSKTEISQFYGVTAEELDNIQILHMAGAIKPWNSAESNYLEEWIAYLENDKDTLLCMRNYCVSNAKQIKTHNDLIKNINNFLPEMNRNFNNENVFLRNKITELEYKIKILEERELILVEAKEQTNMQLVQQADELQLCRHRLDMLENAWSKRVARKIKKILGKK